MIGVRIAQWSDPQDRHALETIRYQVFVAEQGVAVEEEMDDFDATSTHLLATSTDAGTVGCARIMPTGQIGRMAVLQNLRGRGIGANLLNAAICQAKHLGVLPIFLHAQCHAENFYAQFGFVPQGEVFDEAGIEHITMVLAP